MVLVGPYRVVPCESSSPTVTIIFIRAARRRRMSTMFVAYDPIVRNSIADLEFRSYEPRVQLTIPPIINAKNAVDINAMAIAPLWLFSELELSNVDGRTTC